jgi:hypothetical protein
MDRYRRPISPATKGVEGVEVGAHERRMPMRLGAILLRGRRTGTCTAVSLPHVSERPEAIGASPWSGWMRIGWFGRGGDPESSAPLRLSAVASANAVARPFTCERMAILGTRSPSARSMIPAPRRPAARSEWRASSTGSTLLRGYPLGGRTMTGPRRRSEIDVPPASRSRHAN